MSSDEDDADMENEDMDREFDASINTDVYDEEAGVQLPKMKQPKNRPKGTKEDFASADDYAALIEEDAETAQPDMGDVAAKGIIEVSRGKRAQHDPSRPKQKPPRPLKGASGSNKDSKAALAVAKRRPGQRHKAS